MVESSGSEGVTALVLGFTGGYGRAMAGELARRGVHVRALVRDAAGARALAARLGLDVEIVVGDAHDGDALERASAGASLIVHGVNTPYPTWKREIVPLAERIADAAARRGATLLFPGNVYNFAPGTLIGADTPPAPPTRKGALRVEVERVLRAATQRGARLVVLRGGDFFGLGHGSSWMGQILAGVGKGGPLRMPLADDVRHAWCYLPDFARAHVDLLEASRALGPVVDLPFAGHVTTGRELTAALREALGDPGRAVKPVPWGLYRWVAPFSPLLREVLEMRYLWTEEVLLDPRPLTEVIGELYTTPLVEALRAELRHHGLAA